jgi:two-component system sensor histidine kinase SenX3
MRVAKRTKAIAFFITFGACLLGVAIALNITWIVINWRELGALIVGVIFFGFIIAGIVLNTIFLVREIRRNEQQDSFLNAVTHELKTPIASIRLYLETLQRREVPDEERRNFYRVMLDDTERLQTTVEQVLKAGEARHADDESHRQHVDFAAIVRESVQLAEIRHHLSPGTLRLLNNPDDELVVVGNSEELRTAVANLINNAVKYSTSAAQIAFAQAHQNALTPADGTAVGPETSTALRPGSDESAGTRSPMPEAKDPLIDVEILTPTLDAIELHVRDNGVGIPRSELRRIFRRFYRVPQSTTVIRGTGLGLFIVRSIIRRHGGDVTAESAGIGHGSTFTIRLPRAYRV